MMVKDYKTKGTRSLAGPPPTYKEIRAYKVPLWKNLKKCWGAYKMSLH